MNKAVDTLSTLLQNLPQSKKQEVSGTEVMKLFFMLNSSEHEIYHANKC